MLQFIKKIISEFLPSSLIKLVRKYLKPRKPIMRGVYEKYSDISQDQVWDSPQWLEQQRNALSLIGDWSYLPELSQCFLSVTALHLNLVSKDNVIEVLDFGGGTGFLYFEMKRLGSLLYPQNINWTVIDEQNSLELGRQFKNKEDSIKFFSDIPTPHKFDVLHVSGVLQYIDDIEGTLGDLIETTDPSHIILTRLKGGADNPEYFTESMMWDSQVALHIINVKNLTKFLGLYGFKPVFRSSWAKEYIREDHYHEVPIDHQIYCSSHMFFCKS